MLRQELIKYGFNVLFLFFMAELKQFCKVEWAKTLHSFYFKTLYLFFVSMCVPWELNPQPLRC